MLVTQDSIGGWRTVRLSQPANLRDPRMAALLIVIFPFLGVFGQLGHVSPVLDDFTFKRYTAWFAVLLAGYLWLIGKELRFPTGLLWIAATLLGILVVNYALGSHAQAKWLFNWTGFIFFTLFFCRALCNLTHEEVRFWQARCIRWLFWLVSALTVALSITWARNSGDLWTFILEAQFNNIIAILTSALGIDKQALGLFCGVAVILLATCWKELTRKERLIAVAAGIVMAPALVGIRSMWLGLFLCSVWVVLGKSRPRRLLGYAMLIGLVGIVAGFNQRIIELLEFGFDRLPSIRFAWFAMTERWFGLGNGGYHLYVEQNHQSLVGLFGTERMLEAKRFWEAPESDVVYFLASWGVLSIPFFGYFVWSLHRGAKLLTSKRELWPIERASICAMAFMIFVGISQDNAGELIWWTFMGAGLGVILRHRQRNSRRTMPHACLKQTLSSKQMQLRGSGSGVIGVSRLKDQRF